VISAFNPIVDLPQLNKVYSKEVKIEWTVSATACSGCEKRFPATGHTEAQVFPSRV
jgi:hypothetical protein